MGSLKRQRRGPSSILVTLLDLLTVLGCCAAVAVALFGGDRFQIGPFRISVRDPWRIVLWTVAFGLARWTLWRAVPALPSIRVPVPWTRMEAVRARLAPRRWWPRMLRNAARALPDSRVPWLRLAGISALVIAQPLLDTVARSPEFLVAHDATRGDILAMTAALVLVVPTLLTVPVLLARVLGRRPQNAVESGVVGALVAMLAMQIARHAGVQTAAVAIPAAAAAGMACAIAYYRAPGVRAVAAAAAFSVLVVPGLFFATAGIRNLMKPPPAGGDRTKPSFARVAIDPGRAVPVFLLVFDETPVLSLLDRDGKIDPDLYPSFAALARDGVFFRNATTVSDYTQWAVPAILSGRYPRAAAAPTAADYDETLYTLLGGTYHFEVSEPLTSLCPPAVCPPRRTPPTERLAVLWSDLRYAYLHAISTPDLSRRLPSLTDNWRDFGELGQRRRQGQQQIAARRPGEINISLAEALLDRIHADNERPPFFVLHTLLGHFPHQHLPSGRINATRADVPAFASAAAWNRDEWAILQLYQRHLLTLRFVDGWLSRFMDRLRATDLYRRALVIVTADHGISFEPGTPRRDFSVAAAAQIMRVPLVVKFPEGMSPSIESSTVDGQRISDRNAQTIDILPTIADVLKVALPWRVDGVSLVDAARAEPDAKVMYFDSGRTDMTFSRSGPDLSAALARKLAAFDWGPNPYSVPRPDRFGGLVGRAVRDLPVRDGGGVAEVDYLARLQEYASSADETPFDVGGRFETQRATRGATYVAVAINGVVQAVTRTWDTKPSGWLTTPPPSAWRSGHNDLQVFVVEGDERAPVLRECELRASGS